jgi:hypothetical protein
MILIEDNLYCFLYKIEIFKHSGHYIQNTIQIVE